MSTPDGRYIVVADRLWRAADPALSSERHCELVSALMAARRAVAAGQRAGEDQERRARREVDQSKRLLGERGPARWTDGAPDFNRRMVRNTPYAAWLVSGFES